MSLPATWRRKLFPPCPSCRSSGGWAEHRNCPDAVAHKAGRSDLYIDIATGETICLACGQKWGLEDTRHYHKCGAVFDGGEIWQGMAAELGQIGNAKWLAAAGIKRGSLETKMRGWWFCRACKKRFNAPHLIRQGTRRGGLCSGCLLDLDTAQIFRLHSLIPIYRKRRGECAFCGAHARERGGRLKRIPRTHTLICDQCITFMEDQGKAEHQK